MNVEKAVTAQVLEFQTTAFLQWERAEAHLEKRELLFGEIFVSRLFRTPV